MCAPCHLSPLTLSSLLWLGLFDWVLWLGSFGSVPLPWAPYLALFPWLGSFGLVCLSCHAPLQHRCIIWSFHAAVRHISSFDGMHAFSGSGVRGESALASRLKFKKVFVPSESDESETLLKLCVSHPTRPAARSIFHGHMTHPRAMGIHGRAKSFSNANHGSSAGAALTP